MQQSRFEKLIVSQVFQIFCACSYSRQPTIHVLSQLNPVNRLKKLPNIYFNAFLSFHLRLALSRGVFLSGFPTNTLCAYLTFPIPLTSPPISLNFGEIYANNEKEVSRSGHFRRQRQKQKITGKLPNLRQLLTLYPIIFNHIIKHLPR